MTVAMVDCVVFVACAVLCITGVASGLVTGGWTAAWLHAEMSKAINEAAPSLVDTAYLIDCNMIDDLSGVMVPANGLGISRATLLNRKHFRSETSFQNQYALRAAHWRTYVLSLLKQSSPLT
jgi:hypothetical protein